MRAELSELNGGRVGRSYGFMEMRRNSEEGTRLKRKGPGQMADKECGVVGTSGAFGSLLALIRLAKDRIPMGEGTAI